MPVEEFCDQASASCHKTANSGPKENVEATKHLHRKTCHYKQLPVPNSLQEPPAGEVDEPPPTPAGCVLINLSGVAFSSG